MSDAATPGPPPRRSNVLAEEEMRALAGLYDVGEWLSASYEPSGRSNMSFVIETTTGRYVLRRSNPRKRIEGVRFEARLVDFVRERGFPAPEILAARSGEKFATLDGVLYLLTRFITGTPYDAENPRHLREAGRTFALYHRIVRQFPGPPFFQTPGMLTLLGAEGVAAVARMEGFGPGLLESGERQRLAGILSAARRTCAFLEAQLGPAYPQLPKLVINGSYGRSALIMSDDAVIGVVDYDRASHEVRILDLAYTLKEFCGDRGSFKARREVILSCRCCTRFLGAYRELEALTDEECRLLPLVMRARHVLRIVEKCGNFLAKDAVAPREAAHLRGLLFKLERERAWLEFHERHDEELLRAILAA